MTEYWSGSITFTGLGSDTDFSEVIDATITQASYRLNQMEDWEAQWTAKQEIISTINTQLISYQSALEDLDSVGKFLVKAGSSTNSDILGVTADSDAQEGSHEIIINQRAQNDIWSTSTGWSASDDVVTTSDATFSLTYGTTVLSIDVPAGTTLENLVTRINKDADMGGSVRASLINDGTSYHLQIRGLDQGADNTVTIADSGMTGLDSADFVQTQTAQNAQIKVDGYPPGADEWIERDTNFISDVIDGVTLSLYGTSSGQAIEATVATDTDAVIANIESFVEMTNAIRELIASVDETEEEDDDTTNDDETTVFYNVRGNYGLDMVEQTLQNILAEKGLGFIGYDADTGQGDYYASLAAIGITTDTDENSEDFGNLTIDYDELEEALAADPDGVAALFSAENEGRTYSVDFSYDSSIEGMTEPGEYEVAYTVSNGAITGATINGHTATVNGWTITGAYGQDEAGLAIEVDNHTDGSYSGEVSVRQGKINQTLAALDQITDPLEGTLQIIIDNYQDIIDNNAEQMEQEQARLDRMYTRLVSLYATLESNLGYYENLQTQLESQIDQLE